MGTPCPRAPPVFRLSLNCLSSLEISDRNWPGIPTAQARAKKQAMEVVRVASADTVERRPPKKWSVVDTRDPALRATTDPDLIRELRDPGYGQRGVGSDSREAVQDGTAAKTADDTDTHASKNLVVGPKIHLIHGGMDGVYKRDPVTGKWGARLDGVDGTTSVELMLGGPRAEA